MSFGPKFSKAYVRVLGLKVQYYLQKLHLVFARFCVGVSLLVFGLCFSYQELHAKTKSCREKILIMGAVATAMTLSSEASGGIVSWNSDLHSSARAYDLFQARWPYHQLNEGSLGNLSPESLDSKVISVMDLFEDFYFHTSESGRAELSQLLDPDFLHLSDRTYTEHSPRWVQLRGGRESVRLDFTQFSEWFPLGVTTLYDSTPHTPGLYQFSVVESWGYYVVVTHYAWFTEVPEDFDLYGIEAAYRRASLEVPNSASVFSLLFAGLLSSKRRR